MKVQGIIARADRGSYKPHMDLLIEKYGFRDMPLSDKRNKRIKNAAEMLSDVLGYAVYIFKNFRVFKNNDIIVSTGWASLILKLLIKLGIIRCRKFYWLGFFLHNLKVFPFVKILLKATEIKQEVFIVHAEFDAVLYKEKLNLPSDKLKVLPYGDWKEIAVAPAAHNTTSDYYFAGGYTDRDYKSLIEAFKQIDKKLVIVGSHLNSDLNNIDVPEHITIQKDIDKKSFHELVRNAKVCILPMKQATGASGHMVLLNYMKEGKATIATNMPGIRDYVSPGESAILVDNLVKDLPEVVARLEDNPELVSQLQQGAVKYYNEHFSGASLSRRFEEIVLGA